MYERKDWKDSEFDKMVRIKKDDLDFLKKQKGKKTIAGMLHFIIRKYAADKKPDKIKTAKQKEV